VPRFCRNKNRPGHEKPDTAERRVKIQLREMDEQVTYMQQIQDDDGRSCWINQFNFPAEDSHAVWESARVLGQAFRSAEFQAHITRYPEGTVAVRHVFTPSRGPVWETVSWGVLYHAFAVFLPTMERNVAASVGLVGMSARAFLISGVRLTAGDTNRAHAV
jgi:hypothetical protein